MVAKKRKTPKIYYSKTKNRTPNKVIVRRGLMIVTLSLTALALVCGLWFGLKYTGSLFMSRNPKFTLNVINITSDGRLQPQQLREYARLQTGSNIFLVDFDQLSKKLSEVPLVESVTLERKLPDTLNIHVTERTALAQIRWNSRGMPFLLDRYGVVLPMTRSGTALPIIEGFKQEKLKPGDRIERPGISQCLAILAAADELSLGSKVSFSSFDIRYPDFVTAQVNNGIFVRFPQHSAREKLVRLVGVLQIAKEQGRVLRTVDLTPDGRNVPVVDYIPVPTPIVQ